MAIRSVIALCSLLSIGQAALAQTPDKYKPKPIPTGPECLTSKRLTAAQVEFWRQAFANEVGPVDPRCKPHVEGLLQWFGTLLGHHYLEARKLVDPTPHVERLAELRCDDPIVLVASGWWYQNVQQFDQARSLEQELRTQLRARKAGPLTRY